MSNHKDTELAAGRQEKIAGILRQRRIVRVNELCTDLGASPATIRRDLAEMERRGQTQRVHGGAVCVETRLEEPVFEDKTSLAQKEKQRIAEAALKLVQPTDSIFLDGGSTVLALARMLSETTGITVVTNSLTVVNALSGKGPHLIFVGGEFRRLSQTFVGSLTRHMIDHLHVDKAFMGTIGIADADGMTTTDPREAQTKELIMSHARQVIVLADSTKIGKVSFVKVGALAPGQVLITDSGAPGTELRKLKKKGIKVTVV